MMKLVVGMGSAEDYAAYVKAGADEVFCGYVPEKWQTAYGLTTPLNRREVCYSHVQLGAKSELEILKACQEEMGVPAVLAYNGLHYRQEQYPLLAKIIDSCVQMGFSSVIMADPALLLYLNEAGIAGHLKIHLSGEFGELNRYTLGLLKEQNVSRIIFHRKTTIPDMRSMAEAHPEWEYEAFFLNEACHFHGGYCNSLHCDELAPACREPYRLGSIGNASVEVASEGNVPFGNTVKDNASDQDASRGSGPEGDISDSCVSSDDLPGSSGCGLCALWKLREAGVTHLKIVGRGAYTEDMLRDIRAAKKALMILEESVSEEEYVTRMKQELFLQGCSGVCYYREEI